jgi:hypothetical protein
MAKINANHFPVQFTKVHEEVKLKLDSLLSSAQERCKRSALRPGRFSTGQRAAVFIVQVSPRVYLDDLAKRKISYLRRESKYGTSDFTS